MDNSSKFSKKLNKFKGKLNEARNNMIQGAIMGFMVGGLFGFCLGCYSAIQTRRFMAIPISTIVSGASFSFILGCGSMIRADSQILLEEGTWANVQKFNERILWFYLFTSILTITNQSIEIFKTHLFNSGYLQHTKINKVWNLRA